MLAELAQKKTLDAVCRLLWNGPGHVPLNETPGAGTITKRNSCKGVPFYVLLSDCHGHCPWIRPYYFAIGGAIASLQAPGFLMLRNTNGTFESAGSEGCKNRGNSGTDCRP